EIAAFPCALADPGEHRHAAMELGDVVDQFHDDDGLAHPGPAKGADLAALQEGADQVDNLDAGGEHLGRRRLVHQSGCRAMDGLVLNVVVDGQGVVDGGQCVGEFDVDHRTDDLNDLAFIHLRYSLPSWPPAISKSSLVILPWRRWL